MDRGWAKVPNHETPAERYRRLAAECLDAADNFSPGEQRDALLQMVQVWQRLAEQYDDATPPFSPRGNAADQPVVQQQQQVHPKDEENK